MSDLGEPDDLVASGYDSFYEAWGKSPTLRAIWREHVTGDDYPEDYAHISFLPLVTLRSLADSLRLAAGSVLVDLACGAGGPGLWVAAETGATLVGRDLSTVAVRRATERAEALGVAGQASFAQGSFEDPGLADAVADAVMSVDALQYAPDKAKAIKEMGRILRPGGRLALVAFELDPARVAHLPLWDDAVADYRPLLADAGFTVETYEQLPGWEAKVDAGYRAVVAQQGALEAEMGASAAAAIALEAAITLKVQPYCGHVLAVATRDRAGG
ncbi:MAG: class I SAM-dependent methyltransferase [Microthrixaceae bacterium]